MEQFSLKKYLENSSRKICTREGKDVEIIYTNSPVPHHPIVGFIDKSIYVWTIDGKLIYSKEEPDKNDLFFVDEKEGLTEFEKCVQNILNEPHFQDVQSVKQFSKTLLDLARKELEANYYTKVIDDRMVFKSELHEQSLQTAYDMGKQDVLKDLPKWKKANKETDFEERVLIYEDDYICYDDHVYIDDYYIERNELKKLPKEE